jgi:hypothetical protein
MAARFIARCPLTRTTFRLEWHVIDIKENAVSGLKEDRNIFEDKFAVYYSHSHVGLLLCTVTDRTMNPFIGHV